MGLRFLTASTKAGPQLRQILAVIDGDHNADRPTAMRKCSVAAKLATECDTPVPRRKEPLFWCGSGVLADS